MPPADSYNKQIMDNLKSTLEGVTAGSSYNYTPDRVDIVDPPAIRLLMDQAQRAITLLYLISGGDASEEHFMSGGWNIVRFEVFIFGSQVYSETQQDEFDKIDAGQEQKWDMREKMVRDAKKAILVDINRGGIAQNTNITDVRPVHEVKEVPERAMFEMRLEIVYKYQWATP